MEISTTDILALERTKLANERTFLAYFRTFIVLISSGLAVLKLEFFEPIRWLGYALIAIAPLMIIMGTARFFLVRRRLRKYYS